MRQSFPCLVADERLAGQVIEDRPNTSSPQCFGALIGHRDIGETDDRARAIGNRASDDSLLVIGGDDQHIGIRK